MDSSEIDYAARMHKSLLGVVRDLLKDIARDGLPGDHHFYLGFDTTHPGVAMPDHLRARHPSTMTVVLQHQYWDLVVTDELFSVQLSFNGKQESLVIPFDSMTSFVDPSVQFGIPLQDSAPTTDIIDVSAPVPIDEAIEGNPTEEAAEPGSDDTPEDGDDSDNVITLDMFRKS